MSTKEYLATSTCTPPRIKIANVQVPSDDLASIKGWVKTVRKQKKLAFIQVNDGSNLDGIQCVLTFDEVDNTSREGDILSLRYHYKCSS